MHRARLDEGGIPAAGAATGPGQNGRSVRPRGRRGSAKKARPLRRNLRPARRGDGRGGAGETQQRNGPPAGRDRRARPLGAGPPRGAGDGVAAPPAGGRERRAPFRRRAPPRRARAPAALEPRHPAARRTHEPPRRGVRRLVGGVSEGLQGDAHRRHPRPLFPFERDGVDPRARRRPHLPLQGQLRGVAGAEAGAHGAPAEAERFAPQAPRRRTAVGPHQPLRPPTAPARPRSSNS